MKPTAATVPTRFILITRRSHDWHACYDGDATRWEAGRSPAEAVAKIRASFPELVDVPIRYESAEGVHR